MVDTFASVPKARCVLMDFIEETYQKDDGTQKFVFTEMKELPACQIAGQAGSFVHAESRVGSMAQLATAIASLRNENTLLIDAGDTIQDNMAELFVHEDVHPMVAGLNALDFDVEVTGNHEYNFGMDVARHAHIRAACRSTANETTQLTGRWQDTYSELGGVLGDLSA